MDLDNVVGGTVVISQDYMAVGFTTTGEKYDLMNCTYKEARNYVEDLLEANKNLSNAQFDALVKKELKNKGWINY